MDESPVILVTGSGAARVGKEIACDLAGWGYRIAVHYHTSEEEAQSTVEELNKKGPGAAAFGADLRKEAEVKTLIDSIVEKFGRLDGVVCSAATWLKKSWEKTNTSDFQSEWETNSLSTLLLAKYAGEQMTAQPAGGSIITMIDWAIQRPGTDHLAYFASKGSLPTITQSLAVELAQKNPKIRVNGILPGPILLQDDASDEEKKESIEGSLMKMQGTPHHVALAVRFFLENEYVTGALLPVDGGRTIYAWSR
ncbi:Pteridine reductase 1-putative short-chain dehydrogenase [Planctomycetales bacterium 10988]|nr:Pteridine reductase 1-putative short-chain dehydrogenase [Planctomycetales bacterium 10988]